MNNTGRRATRLNALAMSMLLAVPLTAAAAEALDLGLEELLKTDVMTASRKSQRLHDVAAAVFVISRDDIERSGVTSIPEVLRLAPGVQVARLANNRWAVSARGFNGRFANKLLVLMDGRSIYSPLFSGVLWEVEDTLLEDIDRIEVIRGPGASMWGANAVNGVINIITRKARDTQGSLLVAGAGSEERAFAGLRHGATAGEGHYRIWGKAFDRDESVGLSGRKGNDDWQAVRVGFRGDWPLATGNRLTLSGSAYSGPSGDRWNVPDVASAQGFRSTDVQQNGEGVHLLARHDWVLADGSEASLQGYVDHGEIDVSGAFDEHRTSMDLDFQHRMQAGNYHDVIWGLGYRHSRDKISSAGIINIQPEARDFRLISAFAHDEITLLPQLMRLMLGVRLEHNNFTGFEPQPNLRMMWTPSPQQAVWGAVSRAVRTPSRTERDAQLDLSASPPAAPFPFPILLRNVPRADHELDSERLTAFELGYRHQFGASLSVDLAAFHNRYDRLRSASLGAVQPLPTHVVQNLSPTNSVEAQANGLEVAIEWHPAAWWRIQPSYTYLDVKAEAASADPIDQGNARAFENSAPRHQVSVRSSMSLPAKQQFDLWLRYASKLPSADPRIATIPAYTTLDLRYAWRPAQGVELAVVGQNLLDRRHPEFVPELLPSETMQVQRSAYFKVKWQF